MKIRKQKSGVCSDRTTFYSIRLKPYTLAGLENREAGNYRYNVKVYRAHCRVQKKYPNQTYQLTYRFNSL